MNILSLLKSSNSLSNSFASQSRRSLVSFKGFFDGSKKGADKKEQPKDIFAEDSDNAYLKENNQVQISTFDKLKAKSTSKLVRKKAYKPPTNVEDEIKVLSKDLLQDKFKDDNFLQHEFSDPLVKFKLLTSCIDKFQHDISNTTLNDIRTIGDLVEYFKKEQSDLNPLEYMKEKMDLPPNVHINLEYNRFDPKTDTFFNGKDAFPNRDTVVSSLWYSRKYKAVKKEKEYFDK